jgi:hypothetical protein
VSFRFNNRRAHSEHRGVRICSIFVIFVPPAEPQQRRRDAAVRPLG